MKTQLKHTPLRSLKTDLLILPVAPLNSGEAGSEGKRKPKRSTKKDRPGGAWSRFNSASATLLREIGGVTGPLLSRQIGSQDYRPAFGKRLEVAFDSDISAVRLSGVSALDLKKETSLDEWRRLGGDAVLSGRRLRAKDVMVVLTHLPKADLASIAAAVAEGARLAEYEFLTFKGSARKNGSAPSPRLTLVLDSNPNKALLENIKAELVLADSICFARDLVNTPPSDMTPAELVRHAKQVKRLGGNIKLRVYDHRALAKMKAFAILGVGRGSSVPPAMIHLSYTPRGSARGRKRVTLVGKGVTFDSGGLSIKTGKGMEDMKCDMAGAACVLAVMRALGSMPPASKIKHEVHVLIPTTENMINGDSLKPGDVIAAMNGKTIEVLNTDAEGRLILADALSYASRLKSDLIIDLATLTGACVVALGSEYAGMFATERELGLKLQKAFTSAGERVWPLPLAQEYRSQMDSDVADIKNIGTGGPGAILGALFLKEFVPEGVPWVHLDIAGPAFGVKGNEYIKRGGTGFGVLSLMKFLQAL